MSVCSLDSLVLSIFVLIDNKHNDKKRNPTSKTTKEPKQNSRLGPASNNITGGGRGGGFN